MFKRKLPSGNIQYGEWYLDPLTDKRKRITITLTPSGRKKIDDTVAADAINAKIREIYESSGHVDAITLKTLQDRYIEYQKKHVKPQTAENDCRHLNVIVRLLGADTLSDRLSAAYVSEKLDADPVTYVDEVIHVTKTYSMVIRSISTTKTATSTRDVDVQPELAVCIKKIRKFIREEEIMYGYRTDLFLPAFGGGYINYDVYNKYFRENCERILGRRLTPHALRHTHTAMLAEAGVPLETISRRLGHSDSKITKSVYMHVTEGMRNQDRERMEKVRIL